MATLRNTVSGLLRAAGFDHIAEADRHLLGSRAPSSK